MIELICIKNKSKRFHRKWGWSSPIEISIGQRFLMWRERDKFFIKVGSWCHDVIESGDEWFLNEDETDCRFTTLNVIRDQKINQLI